MWSGVFPALHSVMLFKRSKEPSQQVGDWKQLIPTVVQLETKYGKCLMEG